VTIAFPAQASCSPPCASGPPEGASRMDDQSADLAALLLNHGRTVVLELDAQLQLRAIHNPLLLAEWRESTARRGEDAPATLPELLGELVAPARARDLAAQIAVGTTAQAGLYLGVSALLAPRGGAAERHVALSLHPSPTGGMQLVLRDVSAVSDLQQSLAETRLALDSAMAALRAPPHALRVFLGAALTSISAIRVTLRMPARDEEALRGKLARLHAAVAQLDSEAAPLHLAPVQDACQALLNRVTALLERETLTGDALLPLAALVDRIAATAGTLWRIEEQRHAEPAVVRPRTQGRRQPDWTYASERRWGSFLRHRGMELGVMVTLQMQGAVHVPRHLRVSVDRLLQHMLRNAVEHGIETPEERLAAGKPASATITVNFGSGSATQLRMNVRDDGRGRGLGLTFLRREVTRLGGQIAVAAKPDQYTEFVIDLPIADQREQRPSAAAQ